MPPIGGQDRKDISGMVRSENGEQMARAPRDNLLAALAVARIAPSVTRGQKRLWQLRGETKPSKRILAVRADQNVPFCK